MYVPCMFKERYSGVWVRLSYVPCCSGCSTFILHTPLLSSSSSYLPSYSSSSEAPPISPPLYLSNRIPFLFDLFQFYVELCFILAWLAFFYIYSTHPYSRLLYFFLAVVVSLDQDSNSRWPPRSLRSPAHWSSIYGRLSREKVNRLSQATNEKY